MREPSRKLQSTGFGDGSAKAWNQHRFAARRPLRQKDRETLGLVRRDQERMVPTDRRNPGLRPGAAREISGRPPPGGPLRGDGRANLAGVGEKVDPPRHPSTLHVFTTLAASIVGNQQEPTALRAAAQRQGRSADHPREADTKSLALGATL